MKRFLLPGSLFILGIASLLLAQTSNQATLRTPAGDKPITFVLQNGQAYVSASDVINALGGTIQPDGTGFKITLNNTVAAFGPDSRFGVVKDDLIEMPALPIVIAATPFVPWQFFQGFLGRAAEQEVSWDSASRVLTIRPRQQSIVSVQMTVTNLQGNSKIVLTLSSPAETTIVKEPDAYLIKFKAPLRAPFSEQAYDDPHVSHATFSGSDLRIQLTSPEVAGDSYKLENPFRIVLDLRKVAAPAPGTPPRAPGVKPSEPAGIRTIVIDPGHGGKEVGAIGPGGLMEKDITLAVARKLAAALQSKINARVVLTREDDSLVSLDQRTAIANQYKADLFLSVHMNAAVVKGAKGSETYFLSLEASDELARRAAETENASTTAASANPSTDLKLILWDLAQQEYLQESSRFAQAIQEEMNRATNVQNRGVKQAPFKVLVGATMPAALVEVGFITNPDEETKIKSDAFQDMMVDALVRAVQRYKTDFEIRIGLIQPVAPLAGVTKAAPPLKARTGT
ncbi:MAG: N-acetylmuramoyl-L-alanine amidase [Thermoanaerobaculia bacterium]